MRIFFLPFQSRYKKHLLMVDLQKDFQPNNWPKPLYQLTPNTSRPILKSVRLTMNTISKELALPVSDNLLLPLEKLISNTPHYASHPIQPACSFTLISIFKNKSVRINAPYIFFQ